MAENRKSPDRREASDKRVGDCPICGSPIREVGETFPFCSQRCRLVDLGKWLGESYRIERHEGK